MGLGDRDDVVEIDGARIFHSVLLSQEDFGWHAADCGSDGRHSDGGQVADGAVPREQDARPLLVGATKPFQADFAASYPSAHDATRSQVAAPPATSGRLRYPRRS